jgi:hypothetical protein
MDGTIARVRTEEEDRRIYPALRTALLTMAVLDTPSLDFGFQVRLSQMARDVLTCEANGIPVASITRQIAKVLLNAERRRDQDLCPGSEDADDGAMMSYKDTATLLANRTQLLAITRESMAEEQARWQHHYARSGQGFGGATPKQAKGGAQSAPPRTPATPASKGQQGGAGNKPAGDGWSKIKKANWHKVYGPQTIDGKAVDLCFFHCNRPGGCSFDEASCRNDHAGYPPEYHGQGFAAIGPTAQQEVVRKCE